MHAAVRCCGTWYHERSGPPNTVDARQRLGTHAAGGRRRRRGELDDRSGTGDAEAWSSPAVVRLAIRVAATRARAFEALDDPHRSAATGAGGHLLGRAALFPPGPPRHRLEWVAHPEARGSERSSPPDGRWRTGRSGGCGETRPRPVARSWTVRHGFIRALPWSLCLCVPMRRSI